MPSNGATTTPSAPVTRRASSDFERQPLRARYAAETRSFYVPPVSVAVDLLYVDRGRDLRKAGPRLSRADQAREVNFSFPMNPTPRSNLCKGRINTGVGWGQPGFAHHQLAT